MKLPEDPFVLELLPEFLDTWIQDVAYQMPKYLQSRNPQDLYRFGHTLKGSCFQFGLEETAQLGIELMALAKEEKWEAAEAMQPRLMQSFLDAKRYVESLSAS